MDDNCMTVILLQDFFGTLTGNDREVERLHWVQVDGVDKRLGGVDSLVMFSVHFADRDCSLIIQVNVRIWNGRTPKDLTKEDLDKCMEKSGKAVPGIPKEGWLWEKQPGVSPGLHKVLEKGEKLRPESVVR